MNTTLHFAPLQSFTDKAYRQTFVQYFEGVDYFYTPYLNVENDGGVSSMKLLDLGDSTNEYCLIPQILPGNIAELKTLVSIAEMKGFSTINLNFGCPWPMVRAKGRGAALIQQPEKVREFIAYIYQNYSFKVSVKTRLGIEANNEIVDFLQDLKSYKGMPIFIHARNAKQMYKGEVDWSTFKSLQEQFPELDLIYNGDINSYQDFIRLQEEISGINEIMIGRGLLQNPFLAWQIKNKTSQFPDNYRTRIIDFLSQLSENIGHDSKDEGHALNRLKAHAVYFTTFSENGKNWFRKLKKTKSLKEFESYLTPAFIE